MLSCRCMSSDLDGICALLDSLDISYCLDSNSSDVSSDPHVLNQINTSSDMNESAIESMVIDNASNRAFYFVKWSGKQILNRYRSVARIASKKRLCSLQNMQSTENAEIMQSTDHAVCRPYSLQAIQSADHTICRPYHLQTI